MKKLVIILISFMLLMSSSTSVFAINQGHKRLMNHTMRDRSIILGLAILSCGYDCAYPKYLYFQGFDKAETAYWNVDCENCSFRIEVKNDEGGSYQVVPCDKLYPDEVPCFKPFTE